jgi:hypothetical protein
MISLKAFAPVLAETLGTTSAAIYERQRALVRLGLLPAPIGRGRGNGVPASANAVAMIIIAMMVTDNLSDTDDRVRTVAEAQVLGRGRAPRCTLTGRRDFKSALVALLRMTDLPEGLTILVSRKKLSAAIHWGNRAEGRSRRTEFGDFMELHFPPFLVVDATLPEGALQSISASLRAANLHDPDEEHTQSTNLGDTH